MVTGLLKPWAVWLLNKRAAVPAVGTGKPQRWLPGTRGSRLVSVTLCPPSPFFFFFLIFCCARRCCQAAPSLAPSPSSWGFVRPSCALLAAPWLSCATSERLQLATGPGPCSSGTDMGCASTQNCTPESSPAPFPAQTLLLLQKMPRVPRRGRMLNLVAPKEQRWWPFLGRCPLFSSLPLPPPLPPKPPVLFHCVAKQDFHCILVSRPALPFVIHRAPRGAWRGTSPHAGSPGSPGTRGPIQALGPEWHTQKPCPRAAAARFASHVCLTST